MKGLLAVLGFYWRGLSPRLKRKWIAAAVMVALAAIVGIVFLAVRIVGPN